MPQELLYKIQIIPSILGVRQQHVAPLWFIVLLDGRPRLGAGDHSSKMKKKSPVSSPTRVARTTHNTSEFATNLVTN